MTHGQNPETPLLNCMVEYVPVTPVQAVRPVQDLVFGRGQTKNFVFEIFFSHIQTDGERHEEERSLRREAPRGAQPGLWVDQTWHNAAKAPQDVAAAE